MSKNTILKALEELERLSFVTAKPRLGYFVIWKDEKSYNLPLLPFQNQLASVQPLSVNLSTVFHTIMLKGAAFDCFPEESSQYISPYLATLIQNINKNNKQHIGSFSGYYDEPAGLKSLREQIVKRYRLRDTFFSTEDIVITSGCQNALYLA